MENNFKNKIINGDSLEKLKKELKELKNITTTKKNFC